MREWRRVPTTTLCGLCINRTIPKGEAALFIKIGPVKRERVRCQNCAGEAPPALPPLRDFSQNEKEIRDFAALQSAMPKRTRGEMRKFADRWSPYKEAE